MKQQNVMKTKPKNLSLFIEIVNILMILISHPRCRYPIFSPLFHKQENLTNKRNGTKLAKQRASMIFQISKILIYRLLRNTHSQLHHFYEILEIIHELEYQTYSAERRPTEKKCIYIV